MRIPTVRIRNPKSGKILTVNLHEWSRDLGKGRWRGWSRVGGETHVEATDREVQKAIEMVEPDAFNKPLHIINDIPEAEESVAETPVEEAVETTEEEEPAEEESTDEAEAGTVPTSNAPVNFEDVIKGD